MNRPRVLLADDHRIVSEGLKSLLAGEFEVVGTVEDGRALVAAAKTLRPDVIVAEISMPRMNGIDAVAQLKKDNPDVRVVFLTMHQDPAYACRALDAGAHGFVVKHSGTAELVRAICAALKGRTFITPSITTDVLRKAKDALRTAEKSSETASAAKFLTPRQCEILRLLGEGRSVRKIAVSLAISPRTVEYHKHQLMEVHGLHSNAELIHFAIKHGLVTV
jgi:DNA-binding NarL/FixJ family response regulator